MLNPIEVLIEKSLNEGIGICIDSFNETNTELSIENVVKKLNELKWAGKGTWTAEYIERYVDNLRGNLNSLIIGNMMRRKIFNIQSQNLVIINLETMKNAFQGWVSARP